MLLSISPDHSYFSKNILYLIQSNLHFRISLHDCPIISLLFASLFPFRLIQNLLTFKVCTVLLTVFFIARFFSFQSPVNIFDFYFISK